MHQFLSANHLCDECFRRFYAVISEPLVPWESLLAGDVQELVHKDFASRALHDLESRVSSCVICLVLFEFLGHCTNDRSKLPERWHFSYSTVVSDTVGSAVLRIYQGPLTHLEPYFGICPPWIGRSRTGFTSIMSFSDYGQTVNTSSRECLSLAKECLRTCVDTHKSCNRPRDEAIKSWNPTRLLHVGAGKHHIQQMAGVVEAVDYMALSYCWGKTPSKESMLTKDTLMELESGIDLLGMPATLRDAAKLCQDLGIDYIWIDRLCIIQDDQDDWLREATQMNLVYNHAKCTLIAAAASADTEGCFTSRNVMSRLPVCIRLSPEQSVNRLRTSDGQPLLDDSPTPQEWSLSHYHKGQRLGKNFTELRAWTLQERILSPRVLYYGDEVFWKCRDSLVSEGNRFKYHKTYQNLESDNLISSRILQSSTSRGDALYSWCKIVRDYTQRAISFQSDKLVAISGIANSYRTAMRCDYISGVWNYGVARQLCWHTVSQSLSPRLDPRSSGVPTWSWASSTLPINFSHTYRGHFENIPLNTSYLHVEGYGDEAHLSKDILEMTPTSLRIECPVLSLQTFEILFGHSIYDMTSGTIDRDWDWLFPEESDSDSNEGTDDDDDDKSCQYSRAGVSEHIMRPIVLAFVSQEYKVIRDSGNSIALVLEEVTPATEADPARYERLGMLSVDTFKIEKHPLLENVDWTSFTPVIGLNKHYLRRIVIQ